MFASAEFLFAKAKGVFANTEVVCVGISEDSLRSKKDSRGRKEDSRGSKEDSRGSKEDSLRSKEDSLRSKEAPRGATGKGLSIKGGFLLLDLPFGCVARGYGIARLRPEPEPNCWDLLEATGNGTCNRQRRTSIFTIHTSQKEASSLF